MLSHRTHSLHKRARAAFTLVEILIVIVILGIIAGITTPQISSAAQDTAMSAFATELRTYEKAASTYMMLTGNLLEDSSSGVVPAGFENYIRPAMWTDGTTIGGSWDAEQNSFGFTSGFGVHFNGVGQTRDDAFMAQIDEFVDDGNLATGLFQKIASDRYYVILRP